MFAEKLGLELWRTEAESGGSIQRALNWLLPYWTGEKPWTHPQITPFACEQVCSLLRRAARVYGDERYETALKNLVLVDTQKIPTNDILDSELNFHGGSP